VGILKRLRGTPIVRHDVEWGMVYSPNPPYEILQTRQIDFATMQKLRRFSRFWDLIANSGNFVQTLPRIWEDRSPFQSFMELTDWLFERTGRQHAIALHRLAELVFLFLIECRKQNPEQVAQLLWQDYQSNGRHELPEFLRPHSHLLDRKTRREALASSLPARQARHLSSQNAPTAQ
jgi:hypothetical protein